MLVIDTLHFMKRFLLLFLVAALPAYGADDCHIVCAAKAEAVRYVHDAKSLATAPLRWDREQWMRFGEGSAAVLALYATDKQTSDFVQRHRSSSTDQFAKTITPFGGHRALQISVLMIAAGAGIHDNTFRDAGRDSLESELLAAGIVTPLLKRAFGRARPIQNEGSHSFHPFDKNFDSFPSGHATNAFAFATAIAGHYDGWVVPTIVYTLASGVAVSRVNDHVHFPSDVLAGALIGHGIAKGILARHTGTKISWQAVPLIDRKSVGVMMAIGPARR
jgi:membrane-associated phospholipid phosphatase